MVFLYTFTAVKDKNSFDLLLFFSIQSLESLSLVFVSKSELVGFGRLTDTAFHSQLTLIPWSMYRKQPLNWQPARDESEISRGPVRSGGSQLQNKQKKKLKE